MEVYALISALGCCIIVLGTEWGHRKQDWLGDNGHFSLEHIGLELWLMPEWRCWTCGLGGPQERVPGWGLSHLYKD